MSDTSTITPTPMCRFCGQHFADSTHSCAAFEQGSTASPQVAQPALTDLNELAKVYASSYASPHHITFTVDGLRNLIAAVARPAQPDTLERVEKALDDLLSYSSVRNAVDSEHLDAADAALSDLRALRQQAAPQEAVAEVVSWTNGSYNRNYQLRWLRDVPEGTKLYATPPAQPATPAPMDEREAFEAWAKSTGYDVRPSILKGSYADMHTDVAYKSWQARAILAASASQPTPGKSVSDTAGVQPSRGGEHE